MDSDFRLLEKCRVCPRNCGVNRLKGELGFCGVDARIVVSHYGPHFGEEPPISGAKGSGNIFFASCNLRCLYCQNHQISHQTTGTIVSAEELASIFLEMQDQGCHNINLVSPTPYAPLIAPALRLAKKHGLSIPVVYNTNGYDSPETLDLLYGLVDIYLPDFKYWNGRIGATLSKVDDYPDHARRAMLAMKEQTGDLVIENGIARRGLLLRHLVLPGSLAGSRQIIRWVKANLGTGTYLSLMAQYMPLHRADQHPMLLRRITETEYEGLISLLVAEGFENVYIQDLESAPLMVPDFRHPRPFDRRGNHGTGQ